MREKYDRQMAETRDILILGGVMAYRYYYSLVFFITAGLVYFLKRTIFQRQSIRWEIALCVMVALMLPFVPCVEGKLRLGIMSRGRFL